MGDVDGPTVGRREDGLEDGLNDGFEDGTKVGIGVDS